MKKMIDARGLSCPQPVLMALEAMRLDNGELTVLVDTDTARENVGRAVASQGWRLMTDVPEDGGFRLVARKE
ncbi:MAG: sulfurtransferase TusA family protein [Desulfobulbaceae bacterium]|jgi:TusA-related sulfurtransferase|nr:sulfurtransferase TusA family protein [Desulfobulbaceae bacterium]